MDDWWLCFDLSVSDEEARSAFRKRYGKEPKRVVRDHNLVWAGPLSEEMLAGRTGMKLEPAAAG